MNMEAEDERGSSLSYYSVLGVSFDSSVEDIRRAYRKLAMRWHPDRWTRTPSLLSVAKSKFQQIQEAYSVLSDQKKRTLYDVGLYDPEEEEGFSDFVQELLSLVAETRREEKTYSLEELQAMLMEMSKGFEPSSLFDKYPIPEDSRCAKRTRLDSSSLNDNSAHLGVSGWGMYGTSGYCR